MKMPSSDKFYIQSINRAFSIVETISKERDSGLSLTALADRVDLPISTVYRILRNLIHWQYIQEDDAGIYRLGFELTNLGSIAGDSVGIKNAAHQLLSEMGEQTRETVYLAILDEENSSVIYIDKIESKSNIKLAAGIGSRNYLHSTANGKSLASGLSDEKIRQFLGISGMPALTESTITEVDVFLDEIRKVKDNGYSVDDMENEPGVRCVASPIFDCKSRIIGSVSLSGISSSVTHELIQQKYRYLVKETADKISRKLGYMGLGVAGFKQGDANG